MNAYQISKSDILDIIFEGRNKDYGAYQLRKTYNQRISLALFLMIVFLVMLFIGRMISKRFASTAVSRVMVIDDNTLQRLPPAEKQPEIPKPKISTPQKIATVKLTNIRVVKDNEVIQPPPDVKQIEEAQIDIKTQDGLKNVDIIAPPSIETGTNVVSGPVSKKNREDSILINVDIQASFPGGAQAWAKYVRRAVESRLDEFSDSDFGTCVVKFVVDKLGNVSDVQATTMKGSKLAELAVNAIRKGPKWIPAQQNGHYVNAYRMQPVTLQNPDQ